MRQRQGESGFTLVETLITLVVLGVVSVALYQVLHSTRGYHEDQRSVLEAQQNARVALNSIAEDFRQVSYGKDPTQPSIYHADSDSVSFVADLFPNPGAEIITFALSDTDDPDTPNPDDRILMKTVRDTTGAVLFSEPQSYGLAADGLLMRYYNGAGLEMGAPVPQPELIGEIMVEVIGVSPRAMRSGGYHEVPLSTTIYPRNLPLTPARSRPNPPDPGGVQVPNCESVTMSWTAPTSNTDGSPLDFNDISHFNFLVGTSLDDLNMHSRLARTISQWTVGELESGNVYLFAVTCVSRSGVESYPYTEWIDLTNGFTPTQVQGLNLVGNGENANLSWNAVTTFSDGSLITTPVHYYVFRGDNQGFPADEAHKIATTSEGQTTYADEEVGLCARQYYRVSAVACANDGAPSDEHWIMLPPPPACPSDVVAEQGVLPGEILMSWSPPTQRTDGGPLAPESLSHYYAYFDTIPGSNGDSVYVSGSTTSAELVGIPLCETFYFNIRAVDTCDNLGELCPANEVAVSTSSPCDPGPPEAATNLQAVGGTDYAQLTWTANTTDCDLDGYRIHYALHPGGPYDGVGAAEGNSPVAVMAEDVTVGATCAYQLSGLVNCSSYYFAVTAADGCVPANTSTYSNEATINTACGSCDIAESCSPWIVTGAGYTDVAFSVANSSGGDEAVAALRPSWQGGALLDEVYAGGTMVWKSDGSAGGDGDIGPVSSGTAITPDQFIVPESADPDDGYELDMAFTGDVRDVEFQVEFDVGGSPCTASGTGRKALLMDDFSDGDYSGWTVTSGRWRVNDGNLYQSRGNRTRWIRTSNVSYGDDFVFEARMKVVSGSVGRFQFNRYGSNQRYLTGLDYYSQQGNLAKMTPGYDDISWGSYNFSVGDWHKLRVEKVGSVYKFYGDCELICQASIYPVPPAGRFGFGTNYSKVRFDDVCIVEQ